MPLTAEDLFPGVVSVESSGRANAVGPKIPGRTERAIGLTQILPSTAAKYGYQASDLYRPDVQWKVYKQEMDYLLKKYHGDPALALAAWNDGEANVDRNSIAPSTMGYITDALRKSPAALAKMRAERTGGVMASASNQIDIGALMSNPHWNDYTPEQQMKILQRVNARIRGATPAPTPQPSAAPTATALPSAVPTAVPSPTAPPNLGLPGGPAIAAAGTMPVVSPPPEEPSEAFPSRTFGAAGPDIPTPLQQLRSTAAQADVAHPIYGYIRRPGTAAARYAFTGHEETPEAREAKAQVIFPQDPVTAAILGSQVGLAAIDPLAEAGIPLLSDVAEAARPVAQLAGYGAQTGPEASVPFAAARRIATTTGFGGLTGAASAPNRAGIPASMGRGALQGAVTGAVNEPFALLQGVVGRTGYKGAYVNEIVSDTGNAIRGAFEEGPELTQIKVRGPWNRPEDFERIYVGSKPEGLKAADRAMDAFKDHVNQRIGGTPFYRQAGGVPLFQITEDLPPVTSAARAGWRPKTRAMTFDDINEVITEHNDRAFSLRGDPGGSLAARENDAIADSVRDQMRDQLNRMFPNERLGDQFATLRRKYGAMKDQMRSFNDKKLWREKELIPENLQNLFSGGKLAKSTSGMLGEDNWRNIVRATRGGLPGPTFAEPSEEGGVHMGIGTSVHPRIHLPRTMKPVGTSQMLKRVGKGWIYPQRAITGIPAAYAAKPLTDFGLGMLPSWVPGAPKLSLEDEETPP